MQKPSPSFNRPNSNLFRNSKPLVMKSIIPSSVDTFRTLDTSTKIVQFRVADSFNYAKKIHSHRSTTKPITLLQVSKATVIFQATNTLPDIS
jgi:hypothetical protein